MNGQQLVAELVAEDRLNVHSRCCWLLARLGAAGDTQPVNHDCHGCQLTAAAARTALGKATAEGPGGTASDEVGPRRLSPCRW